MTSLATHSLPQAISVSRSGIHRLALALVWITVASGGLVASEPAPVDVLSMGLVLLLPTIGLVAITPALLALLTLMLVAAAAAFLAAINAGEVGLALPHSGVTLYLYLASCVFAAFVARRPAAHARLILNAYVWAALIASVAGIVGYFDLLPGAHETMTLYGRATGLFKDPNVYGPFLILPLMYILSRLAAGSTGRGLLLATMPILALGVLLSFSRGAWINFGVCVMTFGILQFLTARTNRSRLRLLTITMGCALASAALVCAALQSDDFRDLLSERAAVTQSYDEGPEGRFGGQEKALGLALRNPFGIGAQQFVPQYHHEEPHNVYLAMFLNAGWVGGLMFIAIIGTTMLHGLRHAFVRCATQPLFLAAYACFVGHACEGLLIDLDHWRHFYLLLGLVWGLMLGHRREPAAAARTHALSA